jgi:predicted nucleotidyltransferase
MRLAKSQINAIIDAAKTCFGEKTQVWLFGSRIDDTKQGGDIDLYIETDLPHGIIDAKLAFQELIWLNFGEQKIDILVRNRTKPMNPIHQIAKETGILLNFSR